MIRYPLENIPRDDYIFPRRIVDAFPTHTDHTVYTEFAPMKREEKIYCYIVAAIGLVAVVLMASGVVK